MKSVESLSFAARSCFQSSTRILPTASSLYYSTVARSPLSGAIMDQTSGIRTEERRELNVDSNNGAKLCSDQIMPHILNLYASRATPADFEIYAPDATFEDPLMCARGVKEIKSAFYSLSKIFSESSIVEYNIKEDLISPGKHEILIDNKQHYKILGRRIDMISLIKLLILKVERLFAMKTGGTDNR